MVRFISFNSLLSYFLASKSVSWHIQQHSPNAGSKSGSKSSTFFCCKCNSSIYHFTISEITTNQSKSVNNIVQSRKTSYGLKKKQDVSKIFFASELWRKTKDKQLIEVRKALYGDSNELCLTRESQYLKVEPETFFNWTKKQQEDYVSKFRQLSIEEVQRKQLIQLGYF